MNFILFMVFGMVEVFAIFSLMFTRFRLPLREYLKEITIVAASVSLVSYLIRVYFELHMLMDILAHIVIYVVFFRYLIKVRVWRAVVISMLYIGYGLINSLVYFGLVKLGAVSSAEVVSNPNSLSAYTVQTVTAAVSFLISYLTYKFNGGWSFIVRPPHEFVYKKPMNRQDTIIVTAVIVVTFLALAVTGWIYQVDGFEGLALYIVLYALLVGLAARRDRK